MPSDELELAKEMSKEAVKQTSAPVQEIGTRTERSRRAVGCRLRQDLPCRGSSAHDCGKPSMKTMSLGFGMYCDMARVLKN